MRLSSTQGGYNENKPEPAARQGILQWQPDHHGRPRRYCGCRIEWVYMRCGI